MKSWLTIKEAAEELGLSPLTVKTQVYRGSLKTVKRGRDLFVTPAALKEYRQNRLGHKGWAARREKEAR